MSSGNKKIGRNDKCSCGSGKKYKVCCLKTHEIQKMKEKEYRDALYRQGEPINENSPQRVKAVYDWMASEPEFLVFQIIDVTNILTAESYRYLQLANYDESTVMIAERRDESDSVFEKRSEEYCNMMILFRGAYYVFNDLSFDSPSTKLAIRKMIHKRMNNENYNEIE